MRASKSDLISLAATVARRLRLFVLKYLYVFKAINFNFVEV
jgi:hypothetical protein